MGLRNTPTWPDVLLPLIETQLVTITGVSSDYVFAALTEELPDPPGTDQFLVLVLGPQRPDQGDVMGGGADLPTLTGDVGVIAWNRFYTDVQNRDELFLTDATYGLLKLTRKVMKALQLFDPQDGLGNLLLQEPMRLSDSGWLTKGRKQKPGWAPAALSFEWRYTADLS